MDGTVTSVMPDLTDLIGTLTGLVTAEQILAIIGTIIGGTVGIWLAWTFARKLVKSFLSVIRGGKIKF